MKRLFTSLVLLALLTGTQAWAESYNLWIGNVQVTDDNKSNIVPTGLTSGSISYNAASNILQFKNVTMSSDGRPCVRNETSTHLYVYFEGTNSLTSNGNSHTIFSKGGRIGLYGNKDNPPRVTLSSNPEEGIGYCAIYQRSEEYLYIYDMYLSANSAGKYCIAGSAGGLVTSCADIQAYAGESVISNFSSWFMSDRGMLLYGDTFDKTKKSVVDAEGNIISNCRLKHGLYVGDAMPLLDANHEVNPNPVGKTKGTITWDASTNKLTLNDVTYSDAFSFITNYNVPDLNIELVGVNSVTGSGSRAAFESHVKTSFTGSGSLYGSDKYGLSIVGNTTVVVNVDGIVRFEGSEFGYYGHHDQTDRPDCDLVLKKAGDSSDYYFKGTNGGIVACSHLLLDDMDFFYSSDYGTAGCYFDENSNTVKKTGGELVRDADINIFAIKSKYPIYVAGHQINNCNINAGPGSPYITTGTINYNPGTNTLTLNGVTLNIPEDNESPAIKTEYAAGDLTLNFTGSTNQTLTTSSDVLDLSSNTTITGTSRIYLNSTKESGITTRNNRSVTIATSFFFETKGAKFAYWGNGGIDEKLTLKKTTSDQFSYRFIGAEGIIHNVQDLVLDNMDFWDGYSITQHEDGYLDGCYFEDRELRVNGGSIAKGAIAFGSIKHTLPVYVCGKQLHSTQKDIYSHDIYVGSPYIDGSPQCISYNPETNSLILDNAVVNYTPDEYENVGVIMTDEGTTLDISVYGNNVLTGNQNAYSGMWLKENNTVTISGGGSLDLSGKFDDLYALNGTVLIVQGYVTLTAMNKGIGSNRLTKELVVYDNATVKAKHISNVETLTLNGGVTITQPQGAEFSAADHAIMLNGELARDVVIKKIQNYGLLVCDVDVTDVNCDDILGDGVFRYDNNTKTLTITNANINDTNIHDVVRNQNIEGLNIVFEGDNNFVVSDDIIALEKSATVTSTGTVTGEVTSVVGYGISLRDKLNLWLNEGTFVFKARKAFFGTNEHEVNMTINEAKVVFEPTAPGYCGIEYLTSLTLGEDMYFSEPEGAYYDPVMKCLTVDGSNGYEGGFVIEKAEGFDLWIANKHVNVFNCNDILGDGVFSYDPVKNKLTVNGDCTYDGYIIQSYIEDLTIKIASASKFTSADKYALIRLYGTTTIKGGPLTLESTCYDKDALGIYLSDGTLTFDEAEVYVIGDGFSYGITGESSTALFILYSDVSVTAHQYGAIYDWGSITLEGCNVIEPSPSQILSNGIAYGDGTIVGQGSEGSVVIAHDPDAINDVKMSDATPAEIYDVAGRKLGQTRRGVNIIRDKEGKVTKLLRK